MDINISVKKGLQIPAFYLFFIICNGQIAVGILGTPKFIFQEAQQDAWISIIIATVYMIIIILVMFYILNNYKNTDIYGIQVDLFGKWIGKVLGVIYLVYFFTTAWSVLITYIQIIQFFIYPEMSAFVMGLLLLSLVVYTINGGIRAIVGVTFIFFLLTPWIIIFLYDPISRMDLTHFHPMFQTSFTQLLKGARSTTYTLSGIELLFVIYPFIQNKEDAKLPTILGASFTAFLVLATTVISIGYYSPPGFDRLGWIVLQLFKSISYQLIERFDYLVVVAWMLLVIPTIILAVWAITHGTKRLFGTRQKTTLYIVTGMLLILTVVFKHQHSPEILTNYVSHASFWIVFVYPIALFLIIFIKKRWQLSKGVKKNEMEEN